MKHKPNRKIIKEIIDKYGVDWDKPWSRQMTLEDLQRDEEGAEA